MQHAGGVGLGWGRYAHREVCVWLEGKRVREAAGQVGKVACYHLACMLREGMLACIEGEGMRVGWESTSCMHACVGLGCIILHAGKEVEGRSWRSGWWCWLGKGHASIQWIDGPGDNALHEYMYAYRRVCVGARAWKVSCSQEARVYVSLHAVQP